MALLATASVTIVALVGLIKSKHQANRTACGLFWGVYVVFALIRTALDAGGML